MDASLTAMETQILEHSLFGASPKREVFRNRFCSGVGCEYHDDILGLIGRGFMILGHKINSGRDAIYFVTDDGMRAIGVDPEKVDPHDRVKRKETTP